MITVELSDLFYQLTGSRPTSVTQLPGSGSSRVYYRLTAGSETLIGACNEDVPENEAFYYLSRHFLNHGLPVPSVLSVSDDRKKYLLSDLGDITLYSLLRQDGTGIMETEEYVLEKYTQAIKLLPGFQITAAKNLDFSVCYPVSSFDVTSIKWDLNYFKYYFLKLSRIPFNENLLENDFERLCRFITGAENHYFMYRDFQSRNIMIFRDSPWFIDFQGGRRGSLQYDVASVLYDAKANLGTRLRKRLLDAYLENITNLYHIDPEKFLVFYPAFSLIRILQALGAYGFRGYFERKEHFLKSIPYALENLRGLLNGLNNPNMPELLRTLTIMTDKSGKFYKKLIELSAENDQSVTAQVQNNILTVRINSFSYRRAIPTDETGNGGGYVFDCRALPNPGRFEEYRNKTGKDAEVIDFLKDDPSVIEFIELARHLVENSIRNYLDRGFSGLMVSFGCTGGKHRSVYCAEKLAVIIRENFTVQVIVHHTEQDLR